MKNIATFGEIMLRLSPPGRERLFQSPRLEAFFGGAEANVAVSLALFGHMVRCVSVLPENEIGEAAAAELRKWGVSTDFIVRKGSRLGIYFAEIGAGPRPSKVVYDRGYSPLAESGPGEIDWNRTLTGIDWFHTTGITPAISASAAELTFEAVKTAKAGKITVSLDLNYRAKLWKYGKKPPEVMRELLRWADIAVANEEDCQNSLGMACEADPACGQVEPSAYEKLTAAVFREFPNLKIIAIRLRECRDTDCNGWSAVMRTRKEFLAGTRYELSSIVDRIGAGDAFAAGLIHGLENEGSDRGALEFAIAASCLKHTIPGDFNLVGEKDVRALLQGGGSGRIQR